MTTMEKQCHVEYSNEQNYWCIVNGSKAVLYDGKVLAKFSSLENAKAKLASLACSHTAERFVIVS